LQIILHADGVPRCKPLLIFHGRGDKKGKLVDGRLLAEYKQYDSRMVVSFNTKACANADKMLQWIKIQFSYSSAFPFRSWEQHHEPRMPTLDVFKGQLNDEVLAAFKGINYTCSFIPSGITGFIQACDVGINKVLKNRVLEQAELHYDNHEEEWIENAYTVGQR
jgi:hypothetical protein